MGLPHSPDIEDRSTPLRSFSSRLRAASAIHADNRVLTNMLVWLFRPTSVLKSSWKRRKQRCCKSSWPTPTPTACTGSQHRQCKGRSWMRTPTKVEWVPAEMVAVLPHRLQQVVVVAMMVVAAAAASKLTWPMAILLGMQQPRWQPQQRRHDCPRNSCQLHHPHPEEAGTAT